FDALQVHAEAALGQASPTTNVQPRMASPISELDQPLGLSFAIGLSVGSDPNDIKLNGSLAVAQSINFDLSFDLAKASLKQLSLSFTGQETFQAELIGHGQQSIEQNVDLGSIGFAPITVILPIPVPPGSVPIVLTPRVDLSVGITGSIQGDVQTSVHQEASFTAGVGYMDGAFKGISDSTSKFDHEQPTYQASANLKAWAGPRLSVLIYGAVGPFAGVDAFVEAKAQAGGPPACAQGTLAAGLSANAGMSVILNYQTTLFDKRFPLAQFDSCSNDPNAPVPALTWARAFGRKGSGGERAKAVVQAPDESYLVVGDSDLFAGTTGFAASVWALRLDPLGNVIWQRAFQRIAELGLARAAAVVSDGFLIAGSAGVVKLDSGGNVVWTKTYKADQPIELGSMAAAADGSFVVAGTYSNGTSAAWAMKLDSAGAVQWSRTFGGGSFTRVRTTADGGFILAGTVDSNAGDMAVTKLDNGGSVVWARALDDRYDGSGGLAAMPTLLSSNDVGNDVIEKPGGGYVAVGQSYGAFPVPEPTQVGFFAAWVAELDANGNLPADGSTLYRAPSSANYSDGYAVGMRSDGEPVIVGRRANESTDLLSNEDVLVIQGGAFNALGGAGNDGVDTGPLSGIGRGMPLLMTADQGALLAVTSNSFVQQDQFWLVKLNRTASIDAPFRSTLSGSSFTNSNATASALPSSSEDIATTAQPFTSMIATESTEITSEQQAL
ncbi:MAG: hypothetical protein JWN04_3018, partial [Myxococcaceae bacterium]|nr:hypothetical protein [Myxococcaceae bacterium]